MPVSTNGKACSAADLLRAAARAPSSRKADAFVFEGDLAEPTKRFLELTTVRDEAEREIGLVRDQLRAALDPWYQEHVAAGHYESSVRIPAGSRCLRVTYQHRYAKFDAGNETELQRLLGKNYDRFFKRVAGLRLRKEVAEDPERLEQVVLAVADALGDQFAEIFEADPQLLPTKAFTERRWADLDQATNRQLDQLGLKQIVVITEQKGK
jgi:hypothetical protein